MSNVLKVSHQEAICSLYQKGWSQRRIARELGINRRTDQALRRGGVKMYQHFDPRLERGIGGKVHRYFDPRLGGCAWKGTGGLDGRSFGPQEPVRTL